MGRDIESLGFRVERWALNNPGASNRDLYAAFPGERKPSLRRSFNEVSNVRRAKGLPPEPPSRRGEHLAYWGEDFFPEGKIDYEAMRRHTRKTPKTEGRNELAERAIRRLRRDVKKLGLTDDQKFAARVEIVFRDGAVKRYSMASFRDFVRGTSGGAEHIDYVRVIDSEVFKP